MKVVSKPFSVILSLSALLLLSGCSSHMKKMEAYNTPLPVVEDTTFEEQSDEIVSDVVFEESEEARLIRERNHEPQIVPFEGDFERNDVVIMTGERKLYVVNGDGSAVQFPIAVGKEGFVWSGEGFIGRKKSHPTWTPPEEMIARRPELQEWADGMPGGIPENPLGERALYLVDDHGEDTLFRIHGTNAPESIGTAASSGCIRMYNQHVVWLYERIPVGARVIVTDDASQIAWVEQE